MYIKATTGVTGIDKHYKYNNKQARAHGLEVGAYHYFTSGGSAHLQFKHFISIAPRENQDLIPMVDVEAYLDKWNKNKYKIVSRCFYNYVRNIMGPIQ